MNRTESFSLSGKVLRQTNAKWILSLDAAEAFTVRKMARIVSAVDVETGNTFQNKLADKLFGSTFLVSLLLLFASVLLLLPLGFYTPPEVIENAFTEEHRLFLSDEHVVIKGVFFPDAVDGKPSWQMVYYVQGKEGFSRQRRINGKENVSFSKDKDILGLEGQKAFEVIQMSHP